MDTILRLSIIFSAKMTREWAAPRRSLVLSPTNVLRADGPSGFWLLLRSGMRSGGGVVDDAPEYFLAVAVSGPRVSWSGRWRQLLTKANWPWPSLSRSSYGPTRAWDS